MIDHSGNKIIVGDLMQTEIRRKDSLAHLVKAVDEERGVLFDDYRSLWIAPLYIGRYWYLVTEDDAPSCDEDRTHDEKVAPTAEFVLSVGTVHPYGFDRRMADLIRIAEETGSISKATKTMGISYSFAWNRLELLEKRLGFEVLSRKGPHGSCLTDRGREFLERYERVAAEVDDCTNAAFAREFGMLAG